MKKTIITALLAIIVVSLASCSSDDDNEDKVEQEMLYVSAETGTYQNVPDNNYVEGMLIKENGAAHKRTVYQKISSHLCQCCSKKFVCLTGKGHRDKQ